MVKLGVTSSSTQQLIDSDLSAMWYVGARQPGVALVTLVQTPEVRMTASIAHSRHLRLPKDADGGEAPRRAVNDDEECQT